MSPRALQLAAVDAVTSTDHVLPGEVLEIGVTLVELTSRDISSAQVAIGLSSTSSPPTTWVTADLDRPGDMLNERSVFVLVDHDAEPGWFVRWARVSLGDEIRFARATRSTVPVVVVPPAPPGPSVHVWDQLDQPVNPALGDVWVNRA